MTNHENNGRYTEEDLEEARKDPLIKWIARFIVFTALCLFFGLVSIAFAGIWRALCWIIGV